jgi:hypothetical protein
VAILGLTVPVTAFSATWSQQQELASSDGASGELFGQAVATSADASTLLVGAYNKNSTTGAVYVFTKSVSTWSQQQGLTASDGASGDYFGASIALSEDESTALVGAFYASSLPSLRR